MSTNSKKRELKIHFNGFEEEQDLTLMGFLELEKYNEDKIEEGAKRLSISVIELDEYMSAED